MTTFKIIVVHMSNLFYLRNTVWTSDPERASEFKSWDDALVGLRKAKPFMKASIYNKAEIKKFD